VWWWGVRLGGGVDGGRSSHTHSGQGLDVEQGSGSCFTSALGPTARTSIFRLRTLHFGIRDSHRCVRPQVDPGPLLSASASSISHTRISLSVSIPSPAPGRRRISRAPTTGGAITKATRGRPRARTNHNSYVQMGCMQPVVPDSLGISVSLAGRN